MIPTVFKLLMQRCGLSITEAAALLGVRRDSVQAWCAGKSPAPDGAMNEMRFIHWSVGQRVDEMLAEYERDETGPFRFVLPVTDAAARARGWPTASIARMAAGWMATMVEEMEITEVK